MQPKYTRCLLKISGESLAGVASHGFDAATIDAYAAEVAEICRLGVQLGVVVGGGNVWRGASAQKGLMERATADAMGMLATVMNSLALSDAIRRCGVPCKVLSAVNMRPIADQFSRQEALSLLDSGSVVVFASGTGNPFFSTDTAAVLRAAEIDAQVILMAKKVDGVYDSDPKTNHEAKLYSRLVFQDVIDQELRVMDLTAASLCKDNNIPILVFNITVPGNMLRAVRGENIGTYLGGANE